MTATRQLSVRQYPSLGYSAALEPRKFVVTGTIVATGWKTEPLDITVTAPHFQRAIEIMDEDARSAGLLLIDARAVLVPVPSAPTFDPTAMQEQGEEVGR